MCRCQRFEDRYRQDRLSTRESDGTGGGHKAKRRADDLVSSADSSRHKRQKYSVGTRCAADRVLRAEFCGKFLLEKSHFRPKDKLLAFHYARDGCHDLVANGGKLRSQIQKIKRRLHLRAGTRPGGILNGGLRHLQSRRENHLESRLPV